MKILPVLCGSLLLAAACGSPVAAQRLVYQQGDSLYSVAEDGKDPRKLFSIGAASGTLWSASPDGRRIVWLTRAAAGSPESAVTGLADRPATVRLSDLTGRRQKRLFSTDRLKDRQNRAVTLVGVPLSSGGGTGTGSLAEWEPVSLSWSADSRTLYVSCFFLPNPAAKAMFAVDAATGIAVIDGDGRWKSIAPVTYAEARGGLIVGSGFARYRPESGGSPLNYSPLVAVNLIEGARNALYTAESGLAELPDYAFASAPALAPENRAIVFTANQRALFLTDKFGKSYRKLFDGNALRPRWSADGKAVLCLLPRPLTGQKAVFDLYRIPLPDSAWESEEVAPVSPTTFTLIVQGVDWFDTVAE
ncbi:MAG: hypothetical protein SFU56_14225 [Capsulimonadales bacterium]|nr:hypothetical protein [Capsulimonadales bacterium]